MCPYSEYREDNRILYCTKINDVCAYSYFCNKIGKCKNTDRYIICPELNKREVSIGMNLVRFERKGFLYIEVGDQVIVMPNPYDYVPTEVKIYKDRDGNYKIKK